MPSDKKGRNNRIKKGSGISIYLGKTTSDTLMDWINSQDNLGPTIIDVLEKYIAGKLVYIPNLEGILAENIQSTRLKNRPSEPVSELHNQEKQEEEINEVLPDIEDAKLEELDEQDEQDEVRLDLAGENPFKEPEESISDEAFSLADENPFEESEEQSKKVREDEDKEKQKVTKTKDSIKIFTSYNTI